MGDKIRIWEIAAANGYRRLVRESSRGKCHYYTAAIHPNGRLLAVGMENGADCGTWPRKAPGLDQVTTRNYHLIRPLGRTADQRV